jgi:hypothetical protein
MVWKLFLGNGCSMLLGIIGNCLSGYSVQKLYPEDGGSTFFRNIGTRLQLYVIIRKTTLLSAPCLLQYVRMQLTLSDTECKSGSRLCDESWCITQYNIVVYEVIIVLIFLFTAQINLPCITWETFISPLIFLVLSMEPIRLSFSPRTAEW